MSYVDCVVAIHGASTPPTQRTNPVRNESWRHKTNGGALGSSVLPMSLEFEMSVIMCTRNGADRISEALESVLAQRTDHTWEVVVVDNGSTDSTVAVVKSSDGYPGRVRIVDASSRAGLAHARNVGVAAARGEFVAFCDDDDLVDEHWIDGLLAALQNHDYVGSQMEYRELNDQRELAGRAEVQSVHLGRAFGSPVVNGACGIRRSLWVQVGGNDETMTVSSEDHDLGIRLHRQLGVVPVLAEGAIYHYRLRTGFAASFRQGRAYGFGYVQLFVRYGTTMTSDDWARCLRIWFWVATRAPFHLFSAKRSVWARHLGYRLGRLEGSVKHRVLCL